MAKYRGRLQNDSDSFYPEPDGYFNGDTVTLTAWGFGYATGTSGSWFINYPLSKPIYAGAVTVKSVDGFVIRGVNGQVISTSTLSQLGITGVTKTDSGIRIAFSGLTTNWSSSLPAVSFGNITVEFKAS